MRKIFLLLPALTAILISCTEKQYEDCPPGHIIGDWGVTNSTHAFGEYDSLYYIVNPIVNLSDSIYFNGDYTDSYYHTDSTRVMLRYTTQDSIIFHFDRMYAVQTNPKHLIMAVREYEKVTKDSVTTEVLDKGECVLHLTKDDSSDKIFRCGPDSLFKTMLRKGGTLHITATNGASSAEPQGSQNYEFVIDAHGFDKALQMADSLNKRAKPAEKDSTKKHPDKKLKL